MMEGISITLSNHYMDNKITLASHLVVTLRHLQPMFLVKLDHN